MATTSAKRARRFALPDHADERTTEAIEAFLTGPRRHRGRPADGHRGAGRPPDPLAALDNRLSWNEALERESARARRYRRPVAVVVVTISPRPGSAAAGRDWLGRLAGPVAHVIRRGARETDLVTRAADARFQVLLPETSERAAARYAERIVADCEIWLAALGAPFAVRATAAGPAGEGTLADALARAVAAAESDVPASS